MRHLFDAPLDRLTAADPGMVRMRQALRTAVSVVLAISVLALLRLPITEIGRASCRERVSVKV